MSGVEPSQGLDPEWSDAIEQAVARFESEWSQGNRAEIEGFLLTDPSLRGLLLLELVHAELEFRLKRGEPARVEEYLERFPELKANQSIVHELVEAERRFRARLDPRLDLAEFHARFPELSLDLGHQAVPGEAGPNEKEPRGSGPPFDASGEPPPRRLGRYDLAEEIGRGAFGAVYRGVDRVLDRTVAVKVLHPGAARAALERFRREARSAAVPRHPNIVPVYEAGVEKGTYYLVSEYVAGEILSHYAVRTEPNPVRSAALVREMAEAVGAAHRVGVIHRDLKPSNVIVESNGRPRVLDFGLARHDAGDPTLTRDGELLGTPAYMAPEQALGDREQVGPWSDVFSLGVILYELLTGRTPFRGAGRLLLWQLAEEEPTPPSRHNAGVPLDLERICLKALAKQPAERYRNASELASDLSRFVRGERIEARVPSRLGRGLGRLRRDPFALAILIALGATLALSAGATAWQWSRNETLRLRAERHARESDRWRRSTQMSFLEANQAVLQFVDLADRLGVGRPAGHSSQPGSLQAALNYYRAFLRDHGNDPSLRVETAHAHRSVASIRFTLRDLAGALEASRLADAIWDRLIAERGLIHEARVGKAESLHSIGALQRLSGQLDEAEISLKKARLRWEELLREAPGTPQVRGFLADTLVSLSLVDKSRGRDEAALETLDTAGSILDRQLNADPADPWSRLARANIDYYRGELLRKRGLAAEALEAARRSLDGWQHVGLDEALVTQLPILRAKAQFLVGASLRDLGRPAEAFAAFEAAAGAYTSLVATRNEESLLRDQAASRHCAADALEELGRVESAADSFQVAADLRDCICERFPRKAAHRSDAAGSWGRLAAILDRLQRLPAAAAAFRRAIGRAEESLAIGGNEAQLRSRLADYHRQLTEVNRRLSNTAPTLSLDTTRGMQPTAEPEFIP